MKQPILTRSEILDGIQSCYIIEFRAGCEKLARDHIKIVARIKRNSWRKAKRKRG